MNNLILPDAIKASDAPLPTIYQQAIVALAECERIDECKEWADKAQSLASYAKQAGDPRLFNYATRIKARAIDRAGALLKEYDGRGDHRKTLGAQGSSPPPMTQREAAKQAGLSEHQQLQAVEINNVPRDQFEAMVESDKPPTTTALAEIGTRARPAPERPPEFAIATHVMGAARRFAEHISGNDPGMVWRGLLDAERDDAIDIMVAIRNWTETFLEREQGT